MADSEPNGPFEERSNPSVSEERPSDGLLSIGDFSKLPTWNRREVSDALSKWQERHGLNKGVAQEAYEECFLEWKNLLVRGMHLAFYGLGSKKELIERFYFRSLKSQSPAIILNGYYPSISIREVSSALCNLVGEKEISCMAFGPSSAELIAECVRRLKRPVYILIHNAEELNKNSPGVWEVLTNQMFRGSKGKIRTIISIDSQYAPAVIHPSLPFMWIEVHTYLPYRLELAYVESSSKSRDEDTMLSAALVTLSALSKASRLMFCLFAHALLTRGVSSGISANALYEQCFNCFIYQTDRRGFGIQVNQYVQYGMMDLNSETGVIKTKLSERSLREILKAHKDCWMGFVDELS